MSAPKPFHLEILSPERRFYTGPCLSLVVPISDGMLGIMAGRAPLTAAITASGAAEPSTPMELVRRLTAQRSTPGTARTAFSTRAEQAAQLMPLTSYWVKFPPLPSQ